jgi:hypothetical protein
MAGHRHGQQAERDGQHEGEQQGMAEVARVHRNTIHTHAPISA